MPQYSLRIRLDVSVYVYAFCVCSGVCAPTVERQHSGIGNRPSAFRSRQFAVLVSLESNIDTKSKLVLRRVRWPTSSIEYIHIYVWPNACVCACVWAQMYVFACEKRGKSMRVATTCRS